MPKPKVFATHGLFDAARQILQKSCDVQYWTKPGRPPREEVLQQVKEKEGLICLLTEKVDEDLLREAPNLRIAANVAVGFDNIDVAACTKRGVAATNTPGVLDETRADFAWTLLLAGARGTGGHGGVDRRSNSVNRGVARMRGDEVAGRRPGLH